MPDVIFQLEDSVSLKSVLENLFKLASSDEDYTFC